MCGTQSVVCLGFHLCYVQSLVCFMCVLSCVLCAVFSLCYVYVFVSYLQFAMTSSLRSEHASPKGIHVCMYIYIYIIYIDIPDAFSFVSKQILRALEPTIESTQLIYVASRGGL